MNLNHSKHRGKNSDNFNFRRIHHKFPEIENKKSTKGYFIPNLEQFRSFTTRWQHLLHLKLSNDTVVIKVAVLTLHHMYRLIPKICEISKQPQFKNYKSNQAVLLPKLFSNYRVNLTKKHLGHSYTYFMNNVYFDIQPIRKFWESVSSRKLGNYNGNINFEIDITKKSSPIN